MKKKEKLLAGVIAVAAIIFFWQRARAEPVPPVEPEPPIEPEPEPPEEEWTTNRAIVGVSISAGRGEYTLWVKPRVYNAGYDSARYVFVGYYVLPDGTRSDAYSNEGVIPAGPLGMSVEMGYTERRAIILGTSIPIVGEWTFVGTVTADGTRRTHTKIKTWIIE